MSSPLAIAATTEIIRLIIEHRLQESDLNLSTLLSGQLKITSIPPALVKSGANDVSSLNIFMYMASYNPGWRNEGLPVRDGRGERIAAPPMPLDLNYLITAYGNQQLHTDILLGSAMQVLYEYPILPRQQIRTLLTVAPYSTSGIADQIEAIKIAPQPITTDDLSKLWSAFQTEYRPSAAYQVSVILIDSKSPATSGPPVRQRTMTVMPLPNPRLDSVNPNAVDIPLPAVPPLPDQYVTLSGSSLYIAGSTEVHYDDGVPNTVPTIATIQSGSDAEIVASVPPTLIAGLHTIRVVRTVSLGIPPTPHIGFASNPLALAVRPRIVLPINIVSIMVDGVALRHVQVKIFPSIVSDQRVSIILNTKNPATPADAQAYELRAPRITATTDTVTLPIEEVETGALRQIVPLGTYLVRINVGGAESSLTTNSSGVYDDPTFVVTP